ncbi:MAG TPA: cyclic pyranopterin monophosphate synthase MoaC [Kofleriaceae bacterium]|nr:cyclic pyranopterin monophosphate synthase MoaC [Kofleriaceae bacterium]
MSEHFDERGRARMVDVGQKPETARCAVATGRVTMTRETGERILSGAVAKGDVLQIARIAAIAGLKRTPELVPLCHPIRVTGVDIDLSVALDPEPAVSITATVRAFDRTGAEMEALCAVAIAGLTIYDMCKGQDRTMVISDILLEKKSGGASGAFVRSP